MNFINTNVILPIARTSAVAQVLTYGLDKTPGKNPFNPIALTAGLLVHGLFEKHLKTLANTLTSKYLTDANKNYGNLMSIPETLGNVAKHVTSCFVGVLAYKLAAQQFPSGQLPKAIVYLAIPATILSVLFTAGKGDPTFGDLRGEIAKLCSSSKTPTTTTTTSTSSAV